MLKIWLPVIILGIGYALGCAWFLYESRRLSKELPPAMKLVIFLGGIALLGYLAEAILDTLNN